MTSVFADTFFWIAITVPTDMAHSRALAVKEKLVTTDEVLSEYLNYFSANKQRRTHASATVKALMRNRHVRIIPQSRESFLAGLELYRARPDKAYSLIDCISMQTMRREELTDALTNDRHFEQEGFRALFRDS